jgi:type IV pilus assembly protein PilN
MIRINLLPHRELKRRERRQQFYVVSGGMIAVGLAIAVLVHTVIGGYVERQERKNAFLRGEIAKLDQQIADIQRLREQIDALLARKQVIESLQANRADVVHLMNELVRRLPEGIYLKSIKQNGDTVVLDGYAQSNARVSNLMRSLDESPFLEQPVLVEVKAATANNRKVSEFILNIGLERPKVDEGAPATGSKR